MRREDFAIRSPLPFPAPEGPNLFARVVRPPNVIKIDSRGVDVIDLG